MSELLSDTIRKLDQARTVASLDAIAAGAGVNPHWLKKFVQGRFRNPGVVTVERLNDYLTRRPG